MGSTSMLTVNHFHILVHLVSFFDMVIKVTRNGLALTSYAHAPHLHVYEHSHARTRTNLT